MRERAEPVGEVRRIATEEPRLSEELRRLAATHEAELSGHTSLRHLDDVRQEWARRQADLEALAAPLEGAHRRPRGGSGAAREPRGPVGARAAGARGRRAARGDGRDDRRRHRGSGGDPRGGGGRSSRRSPRCRPGSRTRPPSSRRRSAIWSARRPTLRSQLFQRDAGPLWASRWDNPGAAVHAAWVSSSGLLVELVHSQPSHGRRLPPAHRGAPRRRALAQPGPRAARGRPAAGVPRGPPSPPGSCPCGSSTRSRRPSPSTSPRSWR